MNNSVCRYVSFSGLGTLEISFVKNTPSFKALTCSVKYMGKAGTCVHLISVYNVSFCSWCIQ